MSCGQPSMKGCSFGQHMVDQTPAYDRKRKGRRKNQVLKGGIIRPDKRCKAKYL